MNSTLTTTSSPAAWLDGVLLPAATAAPAALVIAVDDVRAQETSARAQHAAAATVAKAVVAAAPAAMPFARDLAANDGSPPRGTPV